MICCSGTKGFVITVRNQSIYNESLMGRQKRKAVDMDIRERHGHQDPGPNSDARIRVCACQWTATRSMFPSPRAASFDTAATSPTMTFTSSSAHGKPARAIKNRQHNLPGSRVASCPSQKNTRVERLIQTPETNVL
jgi:hypothetical protein